MPISDEVAVKLVADVEDLISGLKQAEEQTRESLGNIEASTAGVGAALDGIRGQFTEVFEATGILLAYEALSMVKDKLDQIAESALHVSHAAEFFGTSVEELQGLHAAAEEAGVGAHALDMGMRLLTIRMQAAREGSAAMQDRLAAVGITMANLRDGSFDSAKAIEAVAESHATAAQKAQLFGRAALLVVPALENLKGGHDAVIAKARELGALNEDEIARLANYHRAVADVSIQWENFVARLGSAVAPAVIDLMQGFKDLFGTISAGKDTTDAFAEGAREIAGEILKWAAAFQTLALDVKYAFEVIGKALGAAYAANIALLKLQAKEATDIAVAAYADQVAMAEKHSADRLAIAEALKKALEPLEHPETEVVVTARRIKPDNEVKSKGEDPELENLKLEMELAQKGSVERIDLAQRVAARIIETHAGSVKEQIAGEKLILAAVREREQEQLKLGEELAKETQEQQLAQVDYARKVIEDEYALGLISSAQKLELEVTLANQRLAVETTYYQQLDRLRANDEVAHQKYVNAIEKAEAKAAADVLAAQQKASLEVRKQWETALAPIGKAFGDAFKGILNGTETFRQGMRHILQSLVTNFEDDALKIAASWLKSEVLKTEATQVGEAERQAITNQSAILMIAKQAAAAIKFIFNEAAKAFAGAFSAMVGIPYVGPFIAPAAGAAAEAAVVGVASGISGGFLQGGIVPEDMIAKVHGEEMVLPPPISRGLQNLIESGGLTGGGSPTFHIHGHMLDPRGFDKMVKAQGPAIVKALHQQWKKFGTPLQGRT